MNLKVEHYYQLYEGSEKVTIDYLDRLAPGEPQDSLELRYRKAAYMNLVALTIDTYGGYVFSNPPKMSQVYFYDLVPALLSSVFHSTLGGACLVVCLKDDPMPKVFSVLHYKPMSGGGFEVDVNEKGIEGKWLIFEDRIEIRMKGAEVRTEARNEDSVVEIYWNEEKVSLVRDVAPYAVKIFNYDSKADKISDNAALWVSHGGALPDNMSSIRPFMHFERGQGDSPIPGFAAPPADSLPALDARIDKFIIRAGKTVGLQREFADFFAVTSGSAHEMQMVSTNALTAKIAAANVRGVNRAAAGGARLKGAGTKGGEVSLTPALTPQAKSELQRQLTDAAGIINTPEAAEVYAEEIIKATLQGAPDASIERALASIKGKGLAALRYDSLKIL